MTDVGTGERSGRLTVCVTVLRDRAIRRLVAGYFGFMLIETITWTASLVYAYRVGGAGEVGGVSVALLAPAIAVAPLASAAGDRYSRVKVVAISYAVIGAVCALVAVALASTGNRWVVYGLMALAATVVTFPRPAMGALVPCIVARSDQLVATNVALGLAQSLGITAAPVVVAVLLLSGQLWLMFAVSAVVGLGISALVVGLPLRRNPIDPDDDPLTMGDVHHQTLAGLAVLRREPAARRVVGVLGLFAMVHGVIDVAAVVIAVQMLGRSESLTGWLGAANGAGAVIGSALAVALVGRRRLTPAVLLGSVVQIAPLLVVAVWVQPAGALVAFAACGVGLTITDVAGQSLLQRVVPDDVMTRVYGFMEGLQMACIALGSLLCSLAFEWLEPTSAVVVVVAVVALVSAWLAIGLLALDRHRTPPSADLVELLRDMPTFAPLAMTHLERVAGALDRVEVPSGTAIVRQGEVGESLYIVVRGTARVIRDGQWVDVSRPGEHFGEIALLDGTPRNADVIAEVDMVVYELDRDSFVRAVTGHPRALQRTRRLIDNRRSHLPPG